MKIVTQMHGVQSSKIADTQEANVINNYRYFNLF